MTDLVNPEEKEPQVSQVLRADFVEGAIEVTIRYELPADAAQRAATYVRASGHSLAWHITTRQEDGGDPSDEVEWLGSQTFADSAREALYVAFEPFGDFDFPEDCDSAEKVVRQVVAWCHDEVPRDLRQLIAGAQAAFTGNFEEARACIARFATAAGWEPNPSLGES
jgi:hypothetical protein